MLVTSDEKLFRRVLFLRDHGRRPGDKQFWSTEVAYKYKMSSMQAALGLAQLERIDELLERKREIFSWYKQELEGCKGITLNYELPGAKNGYWMVTVVLDPKYGIEKDALQQQLSEREIDCRPFFHPLSSIPAYAHSRQAQEARQRNRVSYEICPFGLNFPSGLNLTRETVQYVCSEFKKILGQ